MLGNMSLSRIPNVALLGLLIFLCLFFDRGFGTAETIVDTDPHVVLEIGTRGILPCRIQRRAYSVEWKRQLSSETELLVSLDTYFDVGAREGPGYEAGLFNIADDYSLVIKDVKVQDEGLYMCSFSDYQTGEPFSNSTRVSVQAFPDEPFPTIQECIGNLVKPDVCTLTIHSTLNLTCFVKGYYPNIDLFFFHGSENMTPSEYEEWNNADETKNKNIRIQISISDEPYDCVASNLPGTSGNRSVSVIVQFQDRPQANSEGPSAAVIAVPVIVGICLSIAAVFIYHHGKGRGWWSRHDQDYSPVPRGNPVTCQKAPEGPVSKLELWQLIEYAEKNDDFEKLRKVVRQLLNTDASTLHTNLDFYESLSTWKNETSSNGNQRESLYSACNELGMADFTGKLIDIVMDASPGVSKAILLHILWEIEEPSKITELLKDFQLDHETFAAAVERGRSEVVYRAHKELVKWRKREFHINPLVILSLKLDDLECETNFFKLPSNKVEDFDVNEMRGRSFQFCCQHLEHLLRVYGGIHGEDVPYQIETLVQENHESLFDTIKMLQDWVQDEECSNYEKRMKLKKAAQASLKRDHTVCKWPRDDDLKVIASFLSPESMEQLCSKLGVKGPPQEANEKERLQALTEWRDNHASSKDLLEKHTELITALKEVGREGLIPLAKSPLVYKAELVDLAFHLFAQDLLPFTENLGISAARLVDYRPSLQPSHMTKGTIGLVCKLFGSGDRSHLLKLLKEIPYPNVSARGMLALEISVQEVCAISVNPSNSKEIEGMQPSFTSSTCMPYGDESFLVTVKEKLISPEAKSTHGDTKDDERDEGIQLQSQHGILNKTTNVLVLASQVEDYDEVSAESVAFLRHFKSWMKQPRLLPFNFRLALANHLRSKGNYDQMSDFLRGHYSEGIIPLSFIHNILETMEPEQRETLRNLITDASFQTEAHNSRCSDCIPFKDKWIQLTESVSAYVYSWISEWIAEMILAKAEKGIEGEIAKKHKECNDKLVDNGFLHLAREIMITEQLPIDASRFTTVCEKAEKAEEP